jgi:hypothetical protein
MLTIKNRSSKISPGGVVTLPLSARRAMVGEARRLLETGEARHFWLEADDEHRRVALNPYGAAPA